MQLASGTQIDRYVVDGLVGRGGMAVVYRARHRQLGSLHAIKLLQSSSVAPDRLMLEGRAQSALRHPNVVAVTDVVEVRGWPALVMDYVDGPSLDGFLASVQPSLEQVDHLAMGILRGVAAAHRLGLVHRDLKPGNVLLAVQDGEIVPKVTDFGLAKLVAPDGDVATRTRTGATMGTPAYMAPEQIRDAHGVDARADVFALGAVLYELVCGRRAFDGVDSLDVMNAVAEARYVPLRDRVPGLPPRMEAAITGALEADRERRIPTVEALIEAWRGGESLSPVTWEPSLLARSTIVRVDDSSGATAPPPTSGETWSGTLPPDASDTSEPSREPAHEAPPRSWSQIAMIVALGTIAGLPFLLGDLMLLFAGTGQQLMNGGLFMLLLIALAAVGVGVIGALAFDERQGRRPILAWLLAPGAVTAVGSVGTWIGAWNALLALEGMEASVRPTFAAVATSVALITQLAGTMVGSTLFVMAALVLAWARQPLVQRTTPTPRMLLPLGLAIVGGGALWAAHPWLSGQPGLGLTAPYLVYLVLVVCGAAASALVSERRVDELVRPQLIVALCAMFGAAHAARAVDARYVMDLSSAFAGGEMIPGDVAAAEAFAASVMLSSAPSITWGALGFLVGIAPLVGRCHPRQLPIPAIAAGVAVLALLSPLKKTADASVGVLAAATLPGSVRSAALWHLGVELGDGAQGIEVLGVASGATAVQVGDRLVSVEDRAFDDAASLVHALWDCRCDAAAGAVAEAAPRCPLAERCLEPGAPVRLTVLRSDGQGPPLKLDLTVPFRPDQPR